jgi:hypothetical protein
MELIGIERIKIWVVFDLTLHSQMLCNIRFAGRAIDMFQDMYQRKLSSWAVIGIALVLATGSATAQQNVYKWVDEDGVVHFGDAPPPNAAIVESSTIKTTQTPASAPAPKPVAATAAVKAPAAQKPVAQPARAKEKDISEMSIDELDRRCEDARERLIAPERDDHIASCKLERRNDPEWCETYFADYGAAVQTGLFTQRPRMYSDLPECVIADSERVRRSQ